MPTPNPINPLTWVKGVQHWFGRTERSSGFRPFLIFLIILFGFSLVLFFSFPQSQTIQTFVIIALSLSIGVFLINFFVKSFQDPDFCRSEKHIQTIKKLELENLGSDMKQLDAEIVEMQLRTESVPESKALTGGN